MPLTMDQAVQIAQTFRTENLWSGADGEIQHFDKPLVKAFSPRDRKICARALDMLSHAQLPEWENDTSSLNSKRIESIIEQVTADIQEPEVKKHARYVKPFIFIAKFIHSLIVGFQNTFIGRVSTNKLWNKIEVHMQDYNVGVKRHKALSDELIDEATCRTNEAADAQRKFIEELIIPLVKVRTQLIFINAIAPSESEVTEVQTIQDLNQDILEKWLVKQTADVIGFMDFKESVLQVLNGQEDDVKEYLKELILAANNVNKKNEDVRKLHCEALKKFTKDFNEQVGPGNEHSITVKKALEAQTMLEKEADLIEKKFLLGSE